MEYNPAMAKKERFGDQLRRAIRESELTRYAISQQTGIAQSILSRFINQGAGLSMDSVEKLCECLGLRLVADVKAGRKRSTKKGG